MDQVINIDVKVNTPEAKKEIQTVRGALGGLKAVVDGMKKTIASAFSWETISKFAKEALTAAGAATIYSKQLQGLSTAFQSLKTVVGTALLPVFGAVAPIVRSSIDGLVSLASVFAQVTALLFGGDTAMADGGGAAAKSADQVSTAVSSMGGASKKAAREMGGILASFDELNILSKKTTGGWGDVSATVIPKIENTENTVGHVKISPAIVQFINELNAALGPTKISLDQLWDSLKVVGNFTWEGLKGFFFGFLQPVGNWTLNVNGLPKLITLLAETLVGIDWGKLNGALGTLWEALSRIATFVGDAVIDFYEFFLKPLTEWTMGEALPKFLDVLAQGLMLIDWETIRGGLSGLWQALEPFAEYIGEGLLWLWENVFMPFGTWAMNEVVPSFLELLRLGIEGLNGIIEMAMPVLQWLWDSFLQPVGAWMGEGITIALEMIIGLFEILTGILNGDFNLAMDGADKIIQAVKDSFDHLKDGAILCWNLICEVWVVASGWFHTNVVQPVAGFFAGLWTSVTTTAVGAWTEIQETFRAVADWFNNTVVLPISTFFSELWTNVSTWASTAWAEIKETFIGIAGWIDEHMVQPVKSGFKGFINGLVTMVESFVNFFIRGINSIIGGFNGLSIQVPDNPITGAFTLGFNIQRVPEIRLPRLATGAVIPPNRAFMAVLGDQRSGYNVEAPEGLIRQIVREESGLSAVIPELREILTAIREGKVLMVNNRVLGETAREALASAARAGGTGLVPVR